MRPAPLFHISSAVIYNRYMPPRLRALLTVCFTALLFGSAAHARQSPPATAARILLLPRKIVSGERATIAVLDVNGRLTPNVTVNFSNGDHLTTDQSGRALFVAPLNPGIIFGSIAGRADRVPTTVIAPSAEGSTASVTSAPRVASLSDRFDIFGQGFCGDADANIVKIGGQTALVLAASPTSLVILPPSELGPGAARVEIACAKNTG